MYHLLPIKFNFRFFFQLLISFSNLSKLNAVFGSKECDIKLLVLEVFQVAGEEVDAAI